MREVSPEVGRVAPQPRYSLAGLLAPLRVLLPAGKFALPAPDGAFLSPQTLLLNWPKIQGLAAGRGHGNGHASIDPHGPHLKFLQAKAPEPLCNVSFVVFRFAVFGRERNIPAPGMDGDMDRIG